MKNPFIFGPVIEKSAFCNRKTELEELTALIKSGQHVFLYAERRVGKTSLIERISKSLNKEEILSCYIDLWPTESETEFIKVCAREISKTFSNKISQAVEIANKFFTRLSPSLSIDNKGEPTLSFKLEDTKNNDEEIRNVLNTAETQAKKQKKQLLIIFDEFQQIINYPNKIEKQLRSIIQHQRHITYVFLGSQKHLIQDLFLNRKNPLFRIGTHYPIGLIDTHHWIPFIQNHFKKTETEISETHIKAIIKETEGHPYFTQYLCHVLWANTHHKTKANQKDIETALRIILERESYEYITLWGHLTQNEKNTLKLITNKNKISYDQESLKTYALSASSLSRATENLIKKGHIDIIKNKTPIILDRFFKHWIKKTFPS